MKELTKSAKIKPNPPLYAFWKYSTGTSRFEPVLGSEVTYMRSDGMISAKGYGPGYFFRPVLLLPKKEGEALHRKLKCIFEGFASEYNSTHKSLLSKYEKLARETAPHLMELAMKAK